MEKFVKELSDDLEKLEQEIAKVKVDILWISDIKVDVFAL